MRGGADGSSTQLIVNLIGRRLINGSPFHFKLKTYELLQLLEETLERKYRLLSAITEALDEEENDELERNYIGVTSQIALLRFLISKLADNGI